MTMKSMSKLLSILLTALVLVSAVTTVMASASYVEATKCLVIVTQEIEGKVETETYQYLLVPDDPTNPMPTGGTSDGYQFEITGNDKVSISITYAKPGVYDYKLYQLKDGQPNPAATVYAFGMIVKNGPDGTLKLTPYTCENDNLILHENGVECTYKIKGAVVPSSTTATPTTKKGSGVHTNDDKQPVLWTTLLCVGFIGAFAVLLLKRKEDEEEKKAKEGAGK